MTKGEKLLIPTALVLSILAAVLAPWTFAVAGGAWLVWQVVRDPAVPQPSVVDHDRHG